jgi:hypothetical protein
LFWTANGDSVVEHGWFSHAGLVVISIAAA